MDTLVFETPAPCDDETCEVCRDLGTYADSAPPPRAPVHVVTIYSAARWTAGRLSMDADGDVFEADVETDDTLAEGACLGSITGRLRKREEYAEELEALAEAWEERQRELAAVRAEDEAIYQRGRL